jgi:conjugal transfer pilus assembly protein TraB
MSANKPSWRERIGNMTPKQKQYAVLGGLVTLIALVVFGSTSLVERQPPMLPQVSKQAPKAKNFAVPGQQVDPRDVWMTQSSSKLQAMDDVVKSLQQKIDSLEKTKAETPAATGGVKALPAAALPTFPTMAEVEAARAQAAQSQQQPAQAQPVPQQLPEPKKPGIAVFEVSEKPVETQAVVERAKTYIPSGSFMRSITLSGLDAPAGGQAQENPHPLLLRVQDNAFLPSRYRARVKECHVLVAGHGDINSERAYMRTESLSCVLKSGEVIDVPVKGYVVGEDGKAGVRGRVVSKQGQVLANALLTGIVSGLGQGVQQMSTTYNTTALGTVGTVDSGKQLQSGVGAGVGKALDRLSQYYITLAEKMFPVIEIDAMREVDVVFTKGVTLGLGEAGDTDGDYSTIWKRGRAALRQPLNTERTN